MKYNIIVATDNNNGIGMNNQMPWYIPEDLIHFKKITSNSIVIMGRNTYESIPIQWRPLNNRLNIVLSNNKQLHIKCENLIYTDEAGMWDAINSYSTIYSNTFFIGGQQVYEKFINITHGIYITRIYKEYKCDTFFINNAIINTHNFLLIHKTHFKYSKEEDCHYLFEYYEKNINNYK